MKNMYKKKRNIKSSLLLLGGLLIGISNPISADFVNYGKIAIGNASVSEVKMSSKIINKNGAKTYLHCSSSPSTISKVTNVGSYKAEDNSDIYLMAVDQQQHSFFELTETATTKDAQSATLVNVALDGEWNGQEIDLISAKKGSDANTFQLGKLYHYEGSKTINQMTGNWNSAHSMMPVLRTRIDGDKIIWYLAPGAILNLKVALEGPMQSSGLMSNRTQLGSRPFYTQCQLPVTDPYGIGATCNNICDENSIGGVVDWIRVDIVKIDTLTKPRGSTTVLETKALLLRPDGSVVDTDGNLPLFYGRLDAVNVLVSHRNHMAVASQYITHFNDTVLTDLTASLDEVLTVQNLSAQQMIYSGNKWVIKAGDLDRNNVLNYLDNLQFNTDLSNLQIDKYSPGEMTLDGIVNYVDKLLFTKNMGTVGLLFLCPIK